MDTYSTRRRYRYSITPPIIHPKYRWYHLLIRVGITASLVAITPSIVGVIPMMVGVYAISTPSIRHHRDSIRTRVMLVV